MRAIYPSHLNLLYLITRIIFGEHCRSLSCTLYSLLFQRRDVTAFPSPLEDHPSPAFPDVYSKHSQLSSISTDRSSIRNPRTRHANFNRDAISKRDSSRKMCKMSVSGTFIYCTRIFSYNLREVYCLQVSLICLQCLLTSRLNVRYIYN
jgi:hypothetical protein